MNLNIFENLVSYLVYILYTSSFTTNGSMVQIEKIELN